MEDKMSATPMIDLVLSVSDVQVIDGLALATELRTLIAERDALKPAPVERRLREIQIAGYADLYRWKDGKLEAAVGNPPRWAVQHVIRTEWIDAVTALRDDPYEPVETVDDVLAKFWDETRVNAMRVNIDAYVARVKVAVRAEAPNAGAGR